MFVERGGRLSSGPSQLPADVGGTCFDGMLTPIFIPCAPLKSTGRRAAALGHCLRPVVKSAENNALLSSSVVLTFKNPSPSPLSQRPLALRHSLEPHRRGTFLRRFAHSTSSHKLANPPLIGTLSLLQDTQSLLAEYSELLAPVAWLWKTWTTASPRPRKRFAGQKLCSSAAHKPAMAAPPIPSLAALAGDPIRTHRTWTPKYGRVQKCDFCNGRAPGTLHVCSECDIRMCENCARDRRWHIQTQHFIDADACDWTVKKAPRRLQNHGTQRASEPSSSSRPSPATRSSAPAPVPLRPSPAQDNTPSEPNRTVEDGHRVPRHGHVDAQFDARAAARHGAEDRLHAYPATYHTSGSGPSFTHPSTASAGPYDRGGMGSGLRRHQDTVPSAPSPAPTHPSDQPPAAIDLVGTRHQSRSFAHRGLLDGNGGVDNETEDGDNVHRDQDGDADDDVYNKKGYVQDVNDGPRRRSNRLVENARARTLTETCAPGRNNNTPSQPAAADSPPATTEGHDHLVLQLYEAIYGNRPNLSPGRVRTRIPDRWDGKWPTAVPQVDYGHRPSTSSQLGPQQPGPNVFGEYSREVWDATVQLQPRLPRPPAGYAEYSFHSFPQVWAPLTLHSSQNPRAPLTDQHV